MYSLISAVPMKSQQPEPHFSLRYYDTTNLCFKYIYMKVISCLKKKQLKNNNNVSKVKPIPC